MYSLTHGSWHTPAPHNWCAVSITRPRTKTRSSWNTFTTDSTLYAVVLRRKLCISEVSRETHLFHVPEMEKKITLWEKGLWFGVFRFWIVGLGVQEYGRHFRKLCDMKDIHWPSLWARLRGDTPQWGVRGQAVGWLSATPAEHLLTNLRVWVYFLFTALAMTPLWAIKHLSLWWFY